MKFRSIDILMQACFHRIKQKAEKSRRLKKAEKSVNVLQKQKFWEIWSTRKHVEDRKVHLVHCAIIDLKNEILGKYWNLLIQNCLNERRKKEAAIFRYRSLLGRVLQGF